MLLDLLARKDTFWPNSTLPETSPARLLAQLAVISNAPKTLGFSTRTVCTEPVMSGLDNRHQPQGGGLNRGRIPVSVTATFRLKGDARKASLARCTENAGLSVTSPVSARPLKLMVAPPATSVKLPVMSGCRSFSKSPKNRSFFGTVRGTGSIDASSLNFCLRPSWNRP